MKMRSFLPGLNELTDSDDSGDEIPPGGMFPIVAAPVEEEFQLEDPDDGDPAAGDNFLLAEEADSSNDDNDDSFDSADNSDSESDDDSSSSEVEATMGDIFGIEPAIEAQRDHPPDLHTDSGIVDVCFHPKREFLAAASMGGETLLYRYSRETVEEVTRFTHHKDACRAVCFSQDGTQLFSISKDKSLAVLDMENSAVSIHIKDAHKAPIFSFTPIDEHLCASGDDEGTIKIWDYRRKKSVFDFRCGEQTVTALTVDDRLHTMAASVADGSIAGFNVRAKKLELQSEMYDSELTSLCLIRSDTKLAVGSGEGIIYIFNWGEFGFHADRFAGHPEYLHCMIPFTDRMMLTGCEDGIIRAVNLYPHRFVGVVGQHKDFGVENMSLSMDGSLLASCSMDEVVRFWNVEYLYELDINERKKGNKRKDVGNNLESSKRRNHGEFFNDFPANVESDDEGGPVAGPSHTAD